ncbi:hypothetical protein OHAE_1073 [Ochrobactrum soli]|uniref:Uncharacterized protein n=1 Tax=Ochrobactrum soli TaxID=2448455 RepID=A0A2P9HM73_9HYPH|nr:hypothetical protein OHAE_1073 [[Ochrobactrum] soli]
MCNHGNRIVSQIGEMSENGRKRKPQALSQMERVSKINSIR